MPMTLDQRHETRLESKFNMAQILVCHEKLVFYDHLDFHDNLLFR